jgi:hypothetical protein
MMLSWSRVQFADVQSLFVLCGVRMRGSRSRVECCEAFATSKNLGTDWPLQLPRLVNVAVCTVLYTLVCF